VTFRPPVVIPVSTSAAPEIYKAPPVIPVAFRDVVEMLVETLSVALRVVVVMLVARSSEITALDTVRLVLFKSAMKALLTVAFVRIVFPEEKVAIDPSCPSRVPTVILSAIKSTTVNDPAVKAPEITQLPPT
jgi:hypothetical protein